MTKIDTPSSVQPLSSVEPARGTGDKIIIRDLTLLASIGVFEHEQQARQPVCISVELELAPLCPDTLADLDNIVRYDHICQQISTHLQGGHISFVETLAEDVARLCLSHQRALRVEVTVLKPNAISNAETVGIKIVRQR